MRDLRTDVGMGVRWIWEWWWMTWRKSCSAYSKTIYIDLSSRMTSFNATTFSCEISLFS